MVAVLALSVVLDLVWNWVRRRRDRTSSTP
jgi:hypothetical protein